MIGLTKLSSRHWIVGNGVGDKSASAIDSITIVELVSGVDAIDMKQATATLNAPVVGTIQRKLDFKGD